MAPKKTTKKPAVKTQPKQAGANYGQYASTTQSGARRWLFNGVPVDARRELSSNNRVQMIGKSRWGIRNSPTYKQVIDEVVLVTIGDELVAQSHAEDPAKGKLYQEYFRNWSKKCDITGRFTFGQVQRLSLFGDLVDGDSFLLQTYDPKTGRPKVQMIEAHRVGPTQDTFNPKCVDGVYLGENGEVIGYNVYVDGDKKDRFIPVESMNHVCEFERSTAVRGYPILQSSLNSVQDQLEVFGLEVRACRDSADSTLILKKQGGVLQDDPAAAFAGNGGTCGNLASQMGGKILVVDTNESFEQLANNRPSPAWIGMMKAIERDIVKLLPVEYVSDPSGITGPAIRLVAAKVSRIAGKWQNLIIDTVCDPTWDYVIAWGIENGELPDDPYFNRKTWITPRDVTVDAGREAAQDRADLQMGLTTATAILGKKGMTHEEVVSTRVKEMSSMVEAAKAAGLPLWMIYQSAFNWLQQGQTPAQMSEDVADNLDVPEPPVTP
jgi:capsid protein